MDTEGSLGSPSGADERQNQHMENALRAIREKKPIPEIDFTLHTMEDGTQVSTMERVCKGMKRPLLVSFIRLLLMERRCAGAGHGQAHR